MSGWWNHLVYRWRRFRGLCYGCGKRPPREASGAVYCWACHRQNIADARQIMLGLQRLKDDP